jgi:hypothetical protein
MASSNPRVRRAMRRKLLATKQKAPSSLVDLQETRASSERFDAAAVFSMVATIATVFLTFCTLVGYTFLVKYYEIFGVRYSDVLIGSEHLFLRGFDILTQNLEMLILLTILFSSLFLSMMNVLFWRWHTATSASTLLLVGFSAAVFAIFNCSRLSEKYAVRDMFSETTALRQLYCLDSEKITLQTFAYEASKSDRKLLVLAKSTNQLILFSEPPIVSSGLRVRVLTLGLSDGDIVETAPANVSTVASDGSFLCDGR